LMCRTSRPFLMRTLEKDTLQKYSTIRACETQDSYGRMLRRVPRWRAPRGEARNFEILSKNVGNNGRTRCAGRTGSLTILVIGEHAPR
jgi:hypothetical protein